MNETIIVESNIPIGQRLLSTAGLMLTMAGSFQASITPSVYYNDPHGNSIVFPIAMQGATDPTINIVSNQRREHLIEKYLDAVGMNRDEFVHAWLNGTVEDSYEANRLSSFLVR